MAPDKNNLPRFNDPAANQERYGFASGPNKRATPPGATWEEGNMFNAGYHLPNFNFELEEFQEPVWRFGAPPSELKIHGEPGAELFSKLMQNDAIRRLQAVEQLTLPPIYTTIPNTGAFSRFEHIWGSVLLVRQMAKKHGVSDDESIKLQLRTLVSDVAHTFGSHLGDWLFQGVGETEDQHDIELKDYLEAVGINDILRNSGYEPDDVVFPEITDWVEAPQPDLCVDRVDYGLREMNRWNDAVRSQNLNAQDFTITPDGMMAMTDARRARIFAEGFLLLSQEHWSEPTHRFMLDMLMLRTKLFYSEGRFPDMWLFNDGSPAPITLNDIHPRDLMYVTDPAQASAYELPSLGGHILESIMKSVALYRRQYVWPGRRERINQYMHQFYDEEAYKKVLQKEAYTTLESSRFNTYMDEYPQTLPVGFAILDKCEAEASKNDSSIDIAQHPFKIRQINPLVATKEGYQRLSELDPSYATRLEEHAAIVSQERVARIMVPDPKSLEAVSSVVENVEEHWQYRLKTSRRMNHQELGGLVTAAAMTVNSNYPFMSFLDF